MMRLAMRRLAPGMLAALVALAWSSGSGSSINRRIDPDESQHLHVAWLLTQGQVPYRDFWEHHLPFFHYAMAPLTAWLADRPEVYFAARARHGAPGRHRGVADLAACAPALGRRRGLGDGDPPVPAPVRGDVDGDATRRARARRPPREPAGAGALARERRPRSGCGRPGPGRARPWRCRSRRSSPSPGSSCSWRASRRRPPPGGAAGPDRSRGSSGACCWFWAPFSRGWRRSAARRRSSGLYRDVVRDSLRFVDFGKTWPVFGSEIGVFLAAALGLGLVLRVRGRAILRHPVHGALLLPALTSAIAPPLAADPGRVPARVAAAAPGRGGLCGPDARHAGGVGAAGARRAGARVSL